MIWVFLRFVSEERGTYIAILEGSLPSAPKKASKKSAKDEAPSGEPNKKPKIEAVKEEAQSTSGINDDSLPYVNVKEENLQNTTTNSMTNSGTLIFYSK